MKHVVLMAIITAGLGAHAQLPEPNRVYGQPDAVTTVYGNPDLPPAARLMQPRGVAVDDTGLYIADKAMNRILFFPASDTVATRVYGQPDFVSGYHNGYGLNADGLALPYYIDASRAGLVEMEWRNARAMHYPPGVTRADLVFGAHNFSCNTPNWNEHPGQGLTYSTGCAIDEDGGVYIADFSFRVLYYPPGSSVATHVYGQDDFLHLETGCSPSRMGAPYGLAADATGVYVCDTMNNRVLFFPKGASEATRVYGQPNMYSSQGNYGGVGPDSLLSPVEVAVDATGVYIADQGNDRVLYYPGTSTTAAYVYGQTDLYTAQAAYGVTTPSRFHPTAVAVDAFGVYVSEEAAARVLRFPKPYAAATHMEFAAQPQAATAGVATGSPVVVRLLHADGSVATEYSGLVRLRLKAGVGPQCAAVSGAVAQAVNGVASFPGLKVDTAGTYVLQATCWTLDTCDSAPFTVSAPPASFAADADHDGRLTLADPVLMMRALFGLDTLG